MAIFGLDMLTCTSDCFNVWAYIKTSHSMNQLFHATSAFLKSFSGDPSLPLFTQGWFSAECEQTNIVSSFQLLLCDQPTMCCFSWSSVIGWPYPASDDLLRPADLPLSLPDHTLLCLLHLLLLVPVRHVFYWGQAQGLLQPCTLLLWTSMLMLSSYTKYWHVMASLDVETSICAIHVCCSTLWQVPHIGKLSHWDLFALVLEAHRTCLFSE